MKRPENVILEPGVIKPSSSVFFLMKEAVEVIEATEVVEAEDVIEAAEASNAREITQYVKDRLFLFFF